MKKKKSIQFLHRPEDLPLLARILKELTFGHTPKLSEDERKHVAAQWIQFDNAAKKHATKKRPENEKAH